MQEDTVNALLYVAECGHSVLLKPECDPLLFYRSPSDVEVTQDIPQHNRAPMLSNMTIGSSNLELYDQRGEKSQLVCPWRDNNSRRPLKSGKDCEVCDVAQTSMLTCKLLV